MPKQRITPDDYTRTLAEIVRGTKAAAKTVVQTETAGDAGLQGGQGFDNPMTAAGSLIVGGESGAPTELPVGAEGQILKIVSGVPTWVDP